MVVDTSVIRALARTSVSFVRFVRVGVALVAALSVSVTSVTPAVAISSSVSSPALAGLPAAPAPALETSGEGAANVSPYDQNNSGAGLMSLTGTGEEQQTAKFEPPETPYNGAFTRTLEIEALPFFELTPKIRLSYNSGDNRQHSGDGFSLLGVGWTMSGGGLIERKSSRGGLPRFVVEDGFELDGNSLLDCVVETVPRATPSCEAGGTHTGRYETYERIVRNASLNSWEVTARDGTVSVYRALGFFAPTSTGDIRLRNDYRWLLQSVTDTDGNSVTYSYDCAALPTCYVTAISYGASSIQFIWETRSDSFTHATGISLANVTKRLKTVAVKAGTSLVRAYTIGYAYSPDTKRSLLTSFRQYGSDAALNATTGAITAGTAFPADTFTYWDMSSRRMGTIISDRVTANTAAETTPSTTATEPALVTDNEEITLDGNIYGDFDGDGADDIINIQVPRFTASGAGQAVNMNLNSYPLLGAAAVGDVNGDGNDDLVSRLSYPQLPEPYRTQLRSTGADYGYAVTYLNGATVIGFSISPAAGADDTRPRIADFNGDGLDDILVDRVLISTGNGFVDQGWGALPELSQIGDVNADGLSDLFTLTGSNGNSSKIYLSTGTGFEVVPYRPNLDGDARGSANDRTADWNGDGATDQEMPGSTLESTGYGFVSTPGGGTVILELHGDGRSERQRKINQSSAEHDVLVQTFVRFGGGWSLVSELDPSNVPRVSGHDFNGDGKPEYLAPHDSAFPDLLKRHTLSAGGTVDVEYLPSSYWTNGYLPMVVQAVSKVTTSDGLGNTSKVKYAYEGGAYDAFEKRFLGFAKVTAELPCEADEPTCPWVHAWYRQEAVAAGSLSKLEVYSPDGKLRRKLENGYVVNQAAAPFTAHKTSEQVTDYLGGNADGPMVTRKEWTYDGYANLLEEKDLGMVGSDHDDLVTTTSYELNLAAYIVDKPGRMTARSAAGTLLRDTQIFYDGAISAGIEPSEGHATTSRQWLASESRWIASTTEYDSFGQPTAEIDPLGHRTERLYDATHQFVTEERNPLWFGGDTRHKTLASWHALCAAPASQTDSPWRMTQLHR